MIARLFAGLLVASAAMAAPSAGAAEPYETRFQSIDGDPIPFSAFRGRPVLVVNTASRCGFTHQYDGLQAIWERYRDQGLVVLGVPSGDFNQELASEQEVKEFCEVNFGLDFPMTKIEKVRGPNAHPFYAWVADQAAQPRWNFYKYLVGADGRLIDSYSSITGPESPALTRQIEAALAEATVRGRWSVREDGAGATN